MPPKIEKPAVATYGDYEVIVPSNPLRKLVTEVPDDDQDDPVARAEKALADLAPEFAGWMEEECERLDLARHAVKAKGFMQTTHSDLFHAAHDIKGEAATFGFPAVAAAADSLCRLIEHTPDMRKIPLALVDQHVDAVRAIYREYARSDARQVAAVLT
jgi:HPt (histidine-containing phosphotransfer) domain-containing protein